MLNIGSRRELFVDTFMIDRLDNTELILHEPVSAGTAIAIDKPWEGESNFGDSVYYIDGKYRMYYRASKPGERSGAMCVAESVDGITWEKPAYNFIPYQEMNQTNMITENPRFIDMRPGVPKEERFKAFISKCKSGEIHDNMYDPGGDKYLEFYTSEDGLNFELMEPQPIMESSLLGSFDGGCDMFWSEVEQKYVFYFRYAVETSADDSFCNYYGNKRTQANVSADTANKSWMRAIARSESTDFIHWSKPEGMCYSDAPEQFYTNNTKPYYRAPHIYISMPARFMDGKAAVTKEQAKECGLAYTPSENEEYPYMYGCSDTVFMTTRAGSKVYDRTFMEAFIRPGIGYGNWTSRCNFMLNGIYQADEKNLMMFVNRNYMQPSWHIERLLLRIDGFASVKAPWHGGTVLTKPFIFEGSELEINYRTSAAGFIKVEITDEDGNIIHAFSENACHAIVGDEIKRVVRWAGDMPLSELSGKPIRLRFYMKDADLYSFKFN